MKFLIFFTLLFFSFPASAQLEGDTTAPGDSCSAYPQGATAMVADSDLDGGSVILVCDGTNWQAMSGGGGGGVSFPLEAPDGSESAPSYGFANGGGIYRGSSGGICIADGSGGTCDFEFDNNLLLINGGLDASVFLSDDIRLRSGQISFDDTGGGFGLYGGSNFACFGSGCDIYITDDGISYGKPLQPINAALDVVGDIHYTGVIQDVSDERLKDNITPLEESLERVVALSGYSFTMKEDETGVVEYGLLAQEVEQVFPELVITGGDGFKTMNYIGMIAPLVEAVKAQQSQIEALEARIAQLEQ